MKKVQKNVSKNDRIQRMQETKEKKSLATAYGKENRKFEVDRLLRKLKDAVFVIQTCTSVKNNKNKPIETKTPNISGQKRHQVKTDLQRSLLEDKQRREKTEVRSKKKGQTNLQYKKETTDRKKAIADQKVSFSKRSNDSRESVMFGVRVENNQRNLSTQQSREENLSEKVVSRKDIKNTERETISQIRYDEISSISFVLLESLEKKRKEDGVEKEIKEKIRDLRN